MITERHAMGNNKSLLIHVDTDEDGPTPPKVQQFVPALINGMSKKNIYHFLKNKILLCKSFEV